MFNATYHTSHSHTEVGVAALPVVVGVMLVVFVIVVTTLTIGFSELLVSQKGEKLRAGVYDSDLGVEEVLIRLTRNPGYPDIASTTPLNLSGLAGGGGSLLVTLSTSLAAQAPADCPELAVDTTSGDQVRTIASAAETAQKASVVETRAVVKIDSQGKLTLCSWEAQ